MLVANTHFMITYGIVHTKEEWQTYFVQEILEVDRWKEATKHRNSAGQNRADAIHVPGIEQCIT